MILMNKKTFQGTSLFLLLLTQVSLTSCYQKELCYTHPHTKNVSVVFDWINSPEASPSTMRLYTYSRDSEWRMHHEFTDRHGGMIGLSQGSYDALCVNSDGPRNFFRNIENLGTFEVYTHEVAVLDGVNAAVSKLPRAKGAERERMVFQPDSVWCDVTATPLVIPFGESMQSTPHILTLRPRPLFCTCTVDIRNVDNLRHLRGVSATLSGMAGGVKASSGIPTDELVTVAFDLEKQRDGTTLGGRFRTFGYTAVHASSRHRLSIYALLDDGSRRFYTYDVTDQVRNSSTPTSIHIVLDKLPLPTTIGTSCSIKPTVNEWGKSEEIDLTASTKDTYN